MGDDEKKLEVAEDVEDLDLTSKKKKKKKKKTPAQEEAEAPPPEPAPTPKAEENDDDDELDLKKKKKKKKKPVEEEKVEEAPETPKENAGDGDKAAEEDDDDDDLDLKKKKKKKKKVQIVTEEEEEESEVEDLDLGEKKKKKKKKKKENAESAEGEKQETADPGALPWAGSDRDYTYEELLQRVTDILRDRNPELGGERRKFLMKPPQVVREGTKKTVFLNFAEICKIMRRNPEHVYQFMLAELGTSGSIDGSQRMVIKGRFQPKAIENILRRYVVEYLTCASCKSPDTLLKKDNRLFFLLCNQCGAQRSVAAIKSGYVAQVGRRKKV